MREMSKWWPRVYTSSLLAASFGGSPTLIWPWEGSNYPSRSCNGRNRPQWPKLKKKQGQQLGMNNPEMLETWRIKLIGTFSSNQKIAALKHTKYPDLQSTKNNLTRNSSLVPLLAWNTWCKFSVHLSPGLFSDPHTIRHNFPRMLLGRAHFQPYYK